MAAGVDCKLFLFVAPCRCCLPYVSSTAGQKWMNMLFNRLVMKACNWSGVNPFGDRCVVS